MKRDSYKTRALQRKVMDYLRGEYGKGVRLVYYLPLGETLKVPVPKLRTMLMPLGGGSDGILLNGEMFHSSRISSGRPAESQRS